MGDVQNIAIYKRKDSSRFLINGFFFFALMPFFSPIPMGSDVQAPAYVFALIIFGLDVLNGRALITKFEVYFIVLGIFTFVFINPEGDFEFKTQVGLLAAFLIYYVAIHYKSYLTSSLLLTVSLITFVGVVWHFLDPGSFAPVGERFARTIKSSDVTFGAGGRGASGFSAENSFAAATAIGQLLSAYYLRNYQRISKDRFNLILLMSLTTITLSMSGLGYLFMALFLGNIFYSSNRNGLKVIIGILVALFLWYILNNPVDNRGVNLLVMLLQNPSLFLQDGSIQERLIGINVGFRSLLFYPFGIGGGAYAEVASEVNAAYQLKAQFPNAYYGIQATVASSAKYLVGYGLLFLVFWVWITVRSISNLTLGKLSCFMATMFILVSFSITLSITYLLFAFSRRERRL